MTNAPAEPGEQDFAELISVATLFEAEMKIAILHQAGITAIVRECGGDFGATPNKAADRDITVLVHRSALGAARDELARINEEAQRVDWDAEEVGDTAQNLTAAPPRAIGPVIIVAMTLLIAAIALILNALFR